MVPIDIANDAVTTADYKVHLQRKLRNTEKNYNLNVKMKKTKLNPAKINTSKFFHLQKDTDPKLFKSEKTGRGPLSG